MFLDLLEGCDQPNARLGELVELVVKFRPISQLSGRDDERHKGGCPARSNCDAIEAGFEIALAAQADHLFGDLAF